MSCKNTTTNINCINHHVNLDPPPPLISWTQLIDMDLRPGQIPSINRWEDMRKLVSNKIDYFDSYHSIFTHLFYVFIHDDEQ